MTDAAESPTAGARPVDRVTGAYLVLSALAFISPLSPRTAPLLALFAIHVVAGLVLVTGRLAPLHRFAARAAEGGDDSARPGPRWLRRAAGIVIDWYPLLLIPAFYTELQVLNSAAWGGHYFDIAVQGWEEAVFGGQPALEMWQRWSTAWVAEPLHFFYLSYYPILYVFPAVVYWRRGREAFNRVLFAMMLAFVVHYMVFVYFPVKGPYFIYPPPGEPVSSGVGYALVQWILANGASSGTAFPSSHVAVSMVQTFNAHRHFRPATPILAVCVVGIALGAVYAGIHYAIDTSIGLFTGAAVGLLVPWARRRLS